MSDDIEPGLIPKVEAYASRYGIVWQRVLGKWWSTGGTAAWDELPAYGHPYTRLIPENGAVNALIHRIDPAVRAATPPFRAQMHD